MATVEMDKEKYLVPACNMICISCDTLMQGSVSVQSVTDDNNQEDW